MKSATGLGRGLGALIDTSRVDTNGSSSISEVNIADIIPNPNQPRRTFDEESLNELAASIREYGVISPITLRKNDDGHYLIIAGERRYRAAKQVGLVTIPAYIKTAEDEQVMAMALIENIQREDLDAIEIALAYQRLIDEYRLTQDKLSERVGKKRATIANYIRLLKLPAEIQMGLKEKKIDMGHARAILAAKSPAQQLDIYKRIITEGLNVRQVEELAKEDEQPLIKENGSEPSTNTTKQKTRSQDAGLSALEQALSLALQTKVTIKQNDNGKGKLTIQFINDEQLQQLCDKLNG